MTRSAVRLAAVAMAIGGAVAMTACSSDKGGAPNAAGAGGGGSRPQDDGAIRQAWVQCMHEAGQTSVQLTKEGQVSVPAAGADGGQSAGAEELQRAMTACDAKVPGMQQLKNKAVQGMVEEARGLAVCLRKNGLTAAQVPDPDPKYGGNLAISPDIDSALFQKAFAICGKDHPGVGVTSLGLDGK
ncbi:hypothetical protein ACFYS8_11860 [Kitasatospora sp. NPDC004615]|uniref:hypothetical protein n=1 Tax=Kitasatospora sp. NPDC004615 TaxID=3364017 RepID=UPI0036A65FBD